MKPLPTPSTPLVTELMLLPDGTVLADNLTPTMADALRRIQLHPDTRTQRSWTGTRKGATIVPLALAGMTEGIP